MNKPAASIPTGGKNAEPSGTPNGAKPGGRRDLFGCVAAWTARASGSRWASLGALGTVVLWAALGPYYKYSEDWQLVINTGTTIVTFLMVFLIQNSQNRESKAVHLKLDELIHAVKHADNQMINIETLTEEQLDMLARRYERIARPLHQELESAVEGIAGDIEEIDERLAAHRFTARPQPGWSDDSEEVAASQLEALASRLDRNVPTTSRTDPTPSPSSSVPSS